LVGKRVGDLVEQFGGVPVYGLVGNNF